MLHGCTIGDNSLVGMGAIILNGARIGADSLVGAGALVTEGKEFPERSLIVGSPAKVIRTLDDAAVERLKSRPSTMSRTGGAFGSGWRRSRVWEESCNRSVTAQLPECISRPVSAQRFRFQTVVSGAVPGACSCGGHRRVRGRAYNRARADSAVRRIREMLKPAA